MAFENSLSYREAGLSFGFLFNIYIINTKFPLLVETLFCGLKLMRVLVAQASQTITRRSL